VREFDAPWIQIQPSNGSCREMNASLRPFVFKKNGQFAREFTESWQVINVQLGAFSPRVESR